MTPSLWNREDMPHEIHKLLARRVSRYFRKLHLFLRHRPLPWRGFASRRGDCFFAGQFLVCQPPSEHRTRGLNEAVRVATFALIVPKRLFVKVAEQMKGLNAHVSTFQSAL